MFETKNVHSNDIAPYPPASIAIPSIKNLLTRCVKKTKHSTVQIHPRKHAICKCPNRLVSNPKPNISSICPLKTHVQLSQLRGNPKKNTLSATEGKVLLAA